jgi:uncharacterized protein (TIGR02391 family)
MVAFRLTEQDILDLPIDELALEVLRDAIANQQRNSANWILLAANEGSYSIAARNILSEAWEWLHAEGLVAHDLQAQNALHAVLTTRLGAKVASEGLESVRAIQRLAVDLHPRIETKARRQFLIGEYETASFVAMKAVEVRVRLMSKSPSSLIGVPLMRKAFGEGGTLREHSLDGGEQNARMELFAGAIGTFKNPTSHRDVEYDDPTVAAEVILFADLLMRMLDGIEEEVERRERKEAAAKLHDAMGTLFKPPGASDL